MKSIMFVCTGNICRSPMAHMYMQKKIYEINRENEYIISSCGTNAGRGECATINAIKAMEEYGVDLKCHRSTPIEESNITDYDLVIALTDYHKRKIIEKYPLIEKKVFTLKEYVKNEDKYIDIDDPWGLDINVYIATAKEITENIDRLLEIL